MTTQESPKAEPPCIFGVEMHKCAGSSFKAMFAGLSVQLVILRTSADVWIGDDHYGSAPSVAAAVALAEKYLSAIAAAITAARQSAEGEPKT